MSVDEAELWTARGTHAAAVLSLFGGIVFRVTVAPGVLARLDARSRDLTERRLAHAVWLSLLAAFVSAGLWFALEAAAISSSESSDRLGSGASASIAGNALRPPASAPLRVAAGNGDRVRGRARRTARHNRSVARRRSCCGSGIFWARRRHAGSGGRHRRRRRSGPRAGRRGLARLPCTTVPGRQCGAFRHCRGGFAAFLAARNRVCGSPGVERRDVGLIAGGQHSGPAGQRLRAGGYAEAGPVPGTPRARGGEPHAVRPRPARQKPRSLHEVAQKWPGDGSRRWPGGGPCGWRARIAGAGDTGIAGQRVRPSARNMTPLHLIRSTGGGENAYRE